MVSVLNMPLRNSSLLCGTRNFELLSNDWSNNISEQGQGTLLVEVKTPPEQG